MKTESPLSSSTSADERLSVSRAPAKPLAKAVLLVTAIAGTLDIIAAHIHIWFATGRFPATVFKGIAGGAIGRERAMQGGAEMVALGVFFHYFISFAFTLLYFLIVPRVALLRRNVWVSGIAYAMFVWTVMNYIVLPLSAFSSKLPNFANVHTYIGACVMVLVFGLPIALGAARFYQPRPVSADAAR